MVSKLLKPADEAFLTQSGVEENPDCFQVPQISLSPFNGQPLKLITVSSALVCEGIGKLRFAQQLSVHLLFSISVLLACLQNSE